MEFWVKPVVKRYKDVAPGDLLLKPFDGHKPVLGIKAREEEKELFVVLDHPGAKGEQFVVANGFGSDTPVLVLNATHKFKFEKNPKHLKTESWGNQPLGAIFWGTDQHQSRALMLVESNLVPPMTHQFFLDVESGELIKTIDHRMVCMTAWSILPVRPMEDEGPLLQFRGA